MTREILFRGFHEDTMGNKTIIVDGKEVKGEWVYGYYWLNAIQRAYITTADGDMYAVIPSTVGQYTGLNDKNGKKIFEGDRCRITRECTLVYSYIKFKNGSFYFKENCAETFINLSDLAYNNNRIEVIGTIFDKEGGKMRLIDIEVIKMQLQLQLLLSPNNSEIEKVIKQLISAIENAPTVDAVAHGRYIIDDFGDCSCSECGSMYINCTDAYCPNCGAKMAPYEP